MHNETIASNRQALQISRLSESQVSIVVSLLGFFLGGYCCLAQGIVDFQNSAAFRTVDPTGGERRVYDAGSPLNRQTGVSLVGTQWVAELYVGINEESMGPVTNSISRFRNSTTSSANKGKWATFTVAGLPNDPTVLPYPYGTTVTLSV